MTRTRTIKAGSLAASALILGLAAIVAACSGAAAGPSASPASPAPSAPASEAPTATPAPSADPTAAPTEAPSEAPALDPLPLDIADDSDVSVAISDPDGLLAGAYAGRAGDGMSVRWGDVEVKNIDAFSVRVTWVGLPVDAQVALAIAAKGDGAAIQLTQPAPPENSDALGYDRVLVLQFAAPIHASELSVSFVAA